MGSVVFYTDHLREQDEPVSPADRVFLGWVGTTYLNLASWDKMSPGQMQQLNFW